MYPHLDTGCTIRELERRLLLEEVARERTLRAGLADQRDRLRNRGWRRLTLAWRTIMPLSSLWTPRAETVDPVGVLRA